MKKQINRESGFTIIEVVLVLAIAGLIFLVVFLALPQLQKSQRDSARQSDVGRLIAGITTYMSNEGNGIAPNTAALVQSEVIDAGYVEDFNYSISDSSFDLDDGAGNEQIQYEQAAECTPDPSGGSVSNRKFLVRAPQESGGNFCREG